MIARDVSVRIMWPPGYPDAYKAETQHALNERTMTDALGYASVHVVSHVVNGREIHERWAFAGIECGVCFGRWPLSSRVAASRRRRRGRGDRSDAC